MPLRYAILCVVLLWTVCAAAQRSTGGGTQEIKSALAARDYAGALDLASAQLKQHPTDPKLWTLQGIAFHGLHREKESLAAYDKALGIAHDYLPALEGAAELEYQNGSPRAASLLNRILQQRANNPTAHAMLAALAYKRHDCGEVARHYAQASELISGQAAALAEYASCLMDLDRPEQAIPVLRQIAGLLPGSPLPRYNLALAQFQAHLGKDAIETLQPLLESKDADPDVLDLAALAYEEQGETPKAVELLRQAIVENPKKITYYLDFATLSFNHQSFEVGIDMLNVGLKNLPDAAPLYVARGILYIQLTQFDKGEADFQAATKLDPGQTSGAVAQGLAQIQQQNLDQALATVKEQLKSHPQDAFLYYLKAHILAQKGAEAGSAEFKEAVEAARRSTELKPDFVLSRDVLGNLYLKSGQFTLAAEQCRLALKGNPSDQEALYHLIQALRESGKASKEEMSDLVKRLAVLRQESRTAEAANNRYKLYEPGASGSTAAPQ